MWNYFRDVRSEMRHVSWPSRRTTIVYTTVVIAVSVVLAAYLGALDYIFRFIIQVII